MRYDGWTYEKVVQENLQILHFAVMESVRIPLDYSPYVEMDAEVFNAFVQQEFPDREQFGINRPIEAEMLLGPNDDLNDLMSYVDEERNNEHLQMIEDDFMQFGYDGY